mmetsp:Transcript_6682/g.17028  ORF Transcript_6682/g.17028 Transcript_6682/m.17028 type:complete len:298 (+) Transcript_6682:1154-2047(+)
MHHCLVGPGMVEHGDHVDFAVEDAQQRPLARSCRSILPRGEELCRRSSPVDELPDALLEPPRHHLRHLVGWAPDDRDDALRDEDGKQAVHDALDISVDHVLSDVGAVDRSIRLGQIQREDAGRQRSEGDIAVEDACYLMCGARLHGTPRELLQERPGHGASEVDVAALVEALREVLANPLDVVFCRLDEVHRWDVWQRVPLASESLIEGDAMVSQAAHLQQWGHHLLAELVVDKDLPGLGASPRLLAAVLELQHLQDRSAVQLLDALLRRHPCSGRATGTGRVLGVQSAAPKWFLRP